jgi:hypothetical protein
VNRRRRIPLHPVLAPARSQVRVVPYLPRPRGAPRRRPDRAPEGGEGQIGDDSNHPRRQTTVGPFPGNSEPAKTLIGRGVDRRARDGQTEAGPVPFSGPGDCVESQTLSPLSKQRSRNPSRVSKVEAGLRSFFGTAICIAATDQVAQRFAGMAGGATVAYRAQPGFQRLIVARAVKGAAYLRHHIRVGIGETLNFSAPVDAWARTWGGGASTAQTNCLGSFGVITEAVSSRAHLLSGLTSFTGYTITLSAVLDAAPLLSDTVQVRPARLVCLARRTCPH